MTSLFSLPKGVASPVRVLFDFKPIFTGGTGSHHSEMLFIFVVGTIAIQTAFSPTNQNSTEHRNNGETVAHSEITVVRSPKWKVKYDGTW